MSQSVHVPHRLTIAEFQDWLPPVDQANHRWELVDGEPVSMAPPSVNHGAIQAELARHIGNWLVATKPSCRVVVGPGVVPRVRADSNERIPDLAIVCGPALPTRHLTDPVLLVEILSPSNEAKTRSNVWAYCSIPSVQEILIVNSTGIGAEILRRGPDGSWPMEPELVAAAGVIVLNSVGMTMPLREAYQTSSLV